MAEVEAKPLTWWQQNWRSVMNWAVAIPCAGFIAPYLHTDVASSPLWHWTTGLGLLLCALTWIFEPKRRR